ncbi:MAG: hypothetical protein ACRBCS_14275 [Cellvibrionaceae bacterium]
MPSQFLAGGVSDKTFNWVCRMLGNNGNGRYNTVLEKALVTGSERLRKYASKAMNETKASEDVEPFLPD